MSEHFSVGRLASLACLLEVCAPKPGNVHRGADFEDVTFEDFVLSAEVLGQAIDTSAEKPVGETILDAVKQTRDAVKTNTNLGMVLLIVPLAKAFQRNNSDGAKLAMSAVGQELEELTAEDSVAIYEAIRIAKPGGIGKASEWDVNSNSTGAPSDVRQAMQLAADRDMIALQYVNNFADVFERVLPLLIEANKQKSLRQSIVETHVRLIAKFGDSLIERKCGADVSANASRLATLAVEQLNENNYDGFHSALAELDFWMRRDGHRRNPGTTADLIAAGLFVGLAKGSISPS